MYFRFSVASYFPLWAPWRKRRKWHIAQRDAPEGSTGFTWQHTVKLTHHGAADKPSATESGVGYKLSHTTTPDTTQTGPSCTVWRACELGIRLPCLCSHQIMGECTVQKLGTIVRCEHVRETRHKRRYKENIQCQRNCKIATNAKSLYTVDLNAGVHKDNSTTEQVCSQ